MHVLIPTLIEFGILDLLWVISPLNCIELSVCFVFVFSEASHQLSDKLLVF